MDKAKLNINGVSPNPLAFLAEPGLVDSKEKGFRCNRDNALMKNYVEISNILDVENIQM